MALKFNCSKCSKEIVVKFLKVGEIVHCRNCGVDSVIPADALSTDESATIDRMPAKRHQSPQQISKPQPITRRKAIVIGLLTGASIIFVGFTLLSTTSVYSPGILSMIGILLIPYILIPALLGMGNTLLFYPVVIIVHGMSCAAIGYLLILRRHKLKKKEEFSIPLFILKLTGISVILSIVFWIIFVLIYFISNNLLGGGW